MKGTKSAKSKKVDLSTVSSILKGSALKAKMPKGIKSKSTKSARSSEPSTALTTKSDPEMAGDYEYKKTRRSNMEKKIQSTESEADAKLMRSADLLKSKMKKIKGMKK